MTDVARTAALWGHQPLRLEHHLHELPAFSRASIAALIDRYPRSRCSLVQLGSSGQRQVRRQGEIGDLSGEAVIEAIERSGMSLDLRNVDEIDSNFFKITETLLQEIAERVADFCPVQFSCDLSISSPRAHIGYRSSARGQLLWQLIGRRRVYVWPPVEPFLAPDQLEDSALSEAEVVMPYARWYDAHARTMELEPGQMLTWPLNAPHRIENCDTLNVTMTLSFSDHDSRRRQHVNVANALLRHRFRYAAKSRAISGPAYWSKAVFQKALKNTAVRRDERCTRRHAEFRLDAAAPGAVIELAAAE